MASAWTIGQTKTTTVLTTTCKISPLGDNAKTTPFFAKSSSFTLLPGGLMV
ncbi:MAG TPA: hypothetical protein QF720_08115 [Nitrospinota bacterium]|nr:hypothetical protein [Nitrospinota bacterium]